MPVSRGTEDDLLQILGWLLKEWREDGREGFWCNRGMIANATPKDMWVVRDGGVAVAFQVGKYSPDIVSVRKDCRKRGFGKQLLEASLKRARRDGVTVLSGECEPRSSLPFWEHMGFRPWEHPGEQHKVLVRYIVEKRHRLPVEAARVPVSVAFYPEDVLHGSQPRPIAVHDSLQGAQLPCGSVLLHRRVIQPRLPYPLTDLAVEVKLNGFRLCLEEARSEEAKRVGICFDREGGAFFIDKVTPPP